MVQKFGFESCSEMYTKALLEINAAALMSLSDRSHWHVLCINPDLYNGRSLGLSVCGCMVNITDSFLLFWSRTIR